MIKEIGINIGFSRESSLFAGLITSSFTVIIYSYYLGSNDLSKSFWILVSLYFALEYINKSEKKIVFAIISVLSFCVALGIKNTTVILLPIYLAVCIFMIRCSQNKLKTFYIIFLSFICGLLASTTIWLYLSNYFWYGDIRGFKENYLTALGNLDYVSIKGRIIRGILYMVSDFGYLPQKIESIVLGIQKLILEFFNVPDTLPKEGGYYVFLKDRIPQRNAFGIVGSLILLPTYLYSIKIFILDKNKAINDKICIFLIVISSASFLLYHAVLNWQPNGLFRLSLDFVLIFAPILAILFKHLFIRKAVTVLAISNYTLITLVLIFISIPTNYITSNNLLNSISSLRYSSHGEFIFDNKKTNEIKELILKDYSSNEVLRTIAKSYLESGFTVAYMGTDEYSLFGKRMENKINSIIDHRLPILKQIKNINFDERYVIIDQRIIDEASQDFLNKKLLENNYIQRLFIIHKKTGIIWFKIYEKLNEA
ncbi:hypothetical protein [Thermodesulfovibrio sp.]|uniref:hypothetical protein n=1 Tax=Thermodesulfovibrio sp. TaxID=2067987 RepID=UPI0030A8C31B